MPAPRVRDRVAVAAFLLLFLIPMFLRATVLPKELPAPMVLRKLHNIACLFTQKPTAWSSYYIQVRYPGEVVWVNLDQRELFPLEPFGRRSRMHRLLVAWGAKPSPLTEDLARWILVEHERRHGDELQPEEIRIARGWSVPSRDEPPQQGWHHPQWQEFPPTQRRIIARYQRDALLGGTHE